MKHFWRSTFIIILIVPLAVSVSDAQRKRKQKEREREDIVQSKTFNVGKGGKLGVSIDGGEIYVTTWEKNEVLVKVLGYGDEYEEDEDGYDGLSMRASSKTVSIENHGGPWDDDSRFDISIPNEFDLDLRTSSGDIIVVGALTGNIRTNTSAGDVSVGDVKGIVDIGTSGGDIETGNITGDLKLKTSGGDIQIGTVTGETDIATSGGNISVTTVKKTLYAKTSGGDVEIGDVGGEAIISTAGGNIRVGKVTGSAKLSTGGGDIELRGASGRVTAKTGGGNVELYNITGSIDAKTGGGDIIGELIPSGKGESYLTSGSGVIRLSIPAEAKATIEASIYYHGKWKRKKNYDPGYRIRSDFPVSTNKNADRNDEEGETAATYVLNGGGEKIFLETTESDIIIRKLTRSGRQ